MPQPSRISFNVLSVGGSSVPVVHSERINRGVDRRPQFQAFGVFLEILRIGGHPQSLGHTRDQQAVFPMSKGWTSVPGGITSDDQMPP